MEARKLIFDGLDIVKQRGQYSKSREEEGIRMEVQETEDQQDGYKETEGILWENLVLAAELLGEVDSGEEDFFDAKRDEEQSNEGEDQGGSLNDPGSDEEEYTGRGSMSLDTNDQSSSDSTAPDDQEDDEEADMSRIGSIQAELDALLWDNQEEKELQSKRQEGYRMLKNPRSFKHQIFNEAGPRFEKMIEKCSQALNQMEAMALGKGRDSNKFSDKLLHLLQSDVGSEDLPRMASKVEEVKEYWEQRKRNDILYTNERRTAILDGLAAGSAGAENDTDDDNLIHNNQARKTYSEYNLTGSRAKND